MRTILVIDDNDSILEEILDILRFEGFVVHGVNNGLSGLAMAEKIRPDLILTDIRMPGISGIEVLTRIKNDKNLKNIPVILISASVTKESISFGLKSGAHNFIQKPFVIEDLLDGINKALQSSDNEKTV